jgi:uncharacterized ion transporter superfamily protein YfcC
MQLTASFRVKAVRSTRENKKNNQQRKITVRTWTFVIILIIPLTMISVFAFMRDSWLFPGVAVCNMLLDCMIAEFPIA